MCDAWATVCSSRLCAESFSVHVEHRAKVLGHWWHRSAARQERRIQALRVCKSMIEATRGGCCTAFPFEAAIWLWEETEELYGGLRPHIPKSCSGNFHDLTNSRVMANVLQWMCSVGMTG